MNTPVYCKFKLMDVQEVASRSHLPYLIITVTVNFWREDLGRMILDIVKMNGCFPAGGKTRVFERPYITARVYNQFGNELMKELATNYEEYFANMCIGMALKLDSQASNTESHIGAPGGLYH